MSDRLEAALLELAEAIRAEVREEATSQAPGPDRLLSVDEAARMLGIGRTRTYYEVQAGQLRSVKVGRRRLIPAAAIGERIALTTSAGVMTRRFGPPVAGSRADTTPAVAQRAVR